MTRPSWVAPRAWLSFIELDKAVVLVWFSVSLVSVWVSVVSVFLWVWFQYVKVVSLYTHFLESFLCQIDVKFCQKLLLYLLRWSCSFYSSICSIKLLSHVQLFVTPWTAAHQASLSITNSQSLLKLMSVESVMPSNHLILYCPLLFQPSIFLSIRVFSNESVLHIRWPKYWDFSFSISPSS